LHYENLFGFTVPGVVPRSRQPENSNVPNPGHECSHHLVRDDLGRLTAALLSKIFARDMTWLAQCDCSSRGDSLFVWVLRLAISLERPPRRHPFFERTLRTGFLSDHREHAPNCVCAVIHPGMEDWLNFPCRIATRSALPTFESKQTISLVVWWQRQVVSSNVGEAPKISQVDSR